VLQDQWRPWSTTWMVDLPPGTSISVRVEVRAR
jgi:hypothetical protein